MLSFSQWALLKEAKTEKIVVYHGTLPKNLKKIMSRGLVPDPPNKIWDKDEDTSFYVSSRQSLGGTYVTTNLMTARSSAQNANRRDNTRSGNLIIIAEIQPKTGFMDEDDLNVFLVISDNEYIIANLYLTVHSTPKDDFVQNLYNKFKNKLNTILFNKLEINPHPQLLNNIEPLLWQLFIAGINRQAAYIDDWTLKKASDFKENIQKPNKTQAEQDFLLAKDNLSKSLKMLANPLNYKEEELFNFTSRIMQPIGFRGANKILAIVYEPHDWKKQPEVLYGTVPEKFISDYTSSVGKWNPKS